MRSKSQILSKLRADGHITDEEYKALEQEPYDDVVSRRAAIEIARSNIHYGLDKEYEYSRELLEKTMAEISSLPPITPQPKTGHWIEKDGFDGDTYYDCSECGESWTTIEGTPWDNEFKYCPNCGCRMVEPQERSE